MKFRAFYLLQSVVKYIFGLPVVSTPTPTGGNGIVQTHTSNNVDISDISRSGSIGKEQEIIIGGKEPIALLFEISRFVN